MTPHPPFDEQLREIAKEQVPAPSGLHEQLMGALHDEWETEARQRRQRRVGWLALGGMAAAILVVIVVSRTAPTPQPEVPMMELAAPISFTLSAPKLPTQFPALGVSESYRNLAGNLTSAVTSPARVVDPFSMRLTAPQLPTEVPLLGSKRS